jgi:hypothetical protein
VTTWHFDINVRVQIDQILDYTMVILVHSKRQLLPIGSWADALDAGAVMDHFRYLIAQLPLDY